MLLPFFCLMVSSRQRVGASSVSAIGWATSITHDGWSSYGTFWVSMILSCAWRQIEMKSKMKVFVGFIVLMF